MGHEKELEFYDKFERAKNILEVPHAKIYFEDGVVPPFTFKVLVGETQNE